MSEIATWASVFMAFLVQFGAVIWRLSIAKGHVYDKINEVEKAILKAELDISESYLKKDAFQAFVNNLDARMIRLEVKLDKALDLA